MNRTVPITLAGALLLAGLSVPAHAEMDNLDLTLLATTDVHGRVFDWDYFAEAPGDIPEDTLGMSLLASVVADVRDREEPESVVLVDNGDAIQGTPLTELYGVGAPEAADLPAHPMATAFNQMGYDALVAGNHEFDYGLDVLDTYVDQLDAPLVAANVVVEATGEPLLEPYTLLDRTIDGEDVTIGVLGLATPGLGTYQVDQMPGLAITDIVSAADTWVPELEELADVVVVLAHSGAGSVPDADYDPAAATEDAVSNLARMTSGIDVIVQGHTHRDNPEQVYANEAGDQVLVTQPYYWARSLSEVSLTLVPEEDGWQVDWSGAGTPRVTPHYAYDVTAPDAAFVEALTPAHEAALDYVERNYEPVAESLQVMRSRTSRYEDTPILDFVNHVQTDTIREAITGTPEDDLPILSQASPLTRTAVFPQGTVTTGHIAGLYIYPNTVDAVLITGAELRDYLENAARYFARVEGEAEFDPVTGTNADGIGDYSYDALSGVEYYIDISQPAGQRITGLAHPDGTAVADDDEFVLALNDFRRTGAGGYPHVSDAPVLHVGETDVRDLLTAWAREQGVIDQADFFVENWGLITSPLVEDPTDEPTEDPTREPTPTEDPTDEPSEDPTGGPTEVPTDDAGGGAPGAIPPSAEAPTGAPGAGGGLPSTGAPVALAGALAVMMLSAGLLLARRRRL